MKFERGRDPMDSMEVGLRSKAKEIYALFLKDKYRSAEGPLMEGYIRLHPEDIPRILESLKGDPDKVMDYVFEQIHSDALSKGAISGPHELSFEMLGYVKYRDKFYYIPVIEYKKVIDNVVNA